MVEIYGKYGVATIYTDLVSSNTISQVQELMNQECIKDSKVAIMPDCHAGAGCVIGTTIKIKDKVIPNLVGVDIGCGMLTVKLGKIDINYEQLDNFIRQNIPYGHGINDSIQDNSFVLEDLDCYSYLKDKAYLLKSLGSLGGGNHFIEIDKDDEDNLYLVIHTGSRYLGKQVATYYQEKAIQYQKDKIFNYESESQKIIKNCISKGQQKLIQSKLNELKNRHVSLPMPEELCYLEGDLFDKYIHDMAICQNFAKRNRQLIASKILKFLKLESRSLESFDTIHNYINMNDMILRKGAISAYEDEIVLIPINMRDGCIIAKGKACEAYNYSAPHGAGRVLSRSEANEIVDLDEYKETMKGIYTTSVCESTKDESPFAYKPIEAIIDNILDTVEIIKIIKPTYNFKAS